MRDPGFARQLAETFEPGFRLNYHLAPPLLAVGSDARGRPLKRAFGPWMGAAFRLLAPMKRLRGTAFDPFGHTAERRMERELIAWYEDILARCPAALAGAEAPRWRRILAAPMDIRGYGPVKEAAAATVRDEVAVLLDGEAARAAA